MNKTALIKINEILDQISSTHQTKVKDLFDEYVKDDNLLRLLLNLEMDFYIKSLDQQFLIDILEKEASKLTKNNLVDILRENCIDLLASSSYSIDYTNDHVSFITIAELIRDLIPLGIKLDSISLESSPDYWIKRLNKIGLKNFRGPFKNRDGDHRTPWLTKFEQIKKVYRDHYGSEELGTCVNDVLGLGYSGSGFVVLTYPNNLKIELKKPTTLDGTLFGFPTGFVNSKPYLIAHGKTVATSGSKHELPEIIHVPIANLTNDFVLGYAGVCKKTVKDDNILDITIQRFNSIKRNYD